MQSATPPIELLEVQTREQATYDALRRAITQGRWGPDEKLVGSRLALDLGVSRITIANALKRLAAEGFVRLTPHKEAVVARLDPAEIREIYLMRAELDALAAREAATRMTPADFLAIDALNDEIGLLSAEPGVAVARLRAADRHFHNRVRAIAAMPRLAETLETLADRCEYYRARLLDPGLLSLPRPQRHGPLLAALRAGDAEASAGAMRRHVLGGMQLILSKLPGQAG